MTVIELSLLCVQDASVFATSTFKSKLKTAQTAMESFTGFRFTYYQQIEDPTRFYILGAWNSVDQHRSDWIPSQANQDLLSLLKDDVQIDWLMHIDIFKPELLLSSVITTIVQDFSDDQSAGYNIESHDDVYLEGQGSHFMLRGQVVDGAPSGTREFVVFSGWRRPVSKQADVVVDSRAVEVRNVRVIKL